MLLPFFAIAPADTHFCLMELSRTERTPPSETRTRLLLADALRRGCTPCNPERSSGSLRQDVSASNKGCWPGPTAGEPWRTFRQAPQGMLHLLLTIWLGRCPDGAGRARRGCNTVFCPFVARTLPPGSTRFVALTAERCFSLFEGLGAALLGESRAEDFRKWG